METILQRLTDLDEISGALLIGKDGLIVSGALQNEDEEMLGAMSAAVFGSIANFTTQVNNGDILHVILETQNGIIQLAEAGELILIVTTQAGGNLGRVRLEMKKASRQIANLVAAY